MFDQEQASAICEQIAQGKSARQAIAEAKQTRAEFYKELAVNPSMQDRYTRAMEQRADWHADRIEELCDDVERGGIKPDAARVAIDARKWVASKLRPQRYGDKLQLDADVRLQVELVDATSAPIAAQVIAQHAAPALRKDEEDDGQA